MSATDILAQNFVYFCDKCFNHFGSSQEQVMRWWSDLRFLLTSKPIDLEKIQVFIKEMYDIPSILRIDTLEKPKIQTSTSQSPLRLRTDKKTSSGLLKKKSPLMLENQINYMYYNDTYDINIEKSKPEIIVEEPKSGLRAISLTDSDLDDDIIAFSTVDLSVFENPISKIQNQTCGENTKNMKYTMDPQKLIWKVANFQRAFQANSEELDKNFECLARELKKNDLEPVKSRSISAQIVEANLKNISFCFNESYEKIKESFYKIY